MDIFIAGWHVAIAREAKSGQRSGVRPVQEPVWSDAEVRLATYVA